MAKSYARRLLNKGKKMARKRYLTKRGLPKVGRIMKDIKQLKRSFNVEKKYVDIPEASHAVGQFSATSATVYSYGYKTHDITPFIQQGLQVGNRTGNSVKIIGASMRIQLYHNTNQISSNYAYLDIFRVDFAQTINDTLATKVFDPNPFYTSAVIDGQSLRNMNYTGVFKKICSRKIYIPADQHEQDRGVKYVNVNLRLNDKIKYNEIGGTPLNCQYIMVYRAANGNISDLFSYSGTEKFPVVTNTTGYIANTVTKWWFVDN